MTEIGAACKARDKIKKHHKSVLDNINSKLTSKVKSVKDTGHKHTNTVKNIKNKTKKKFIKMRKTLNAKYLKLPWKNTRPDITFLAEILLLIVLCVILYYTWPYITGSTLPGFNNKQFMKASKLPATAFNVAELAKVNMEVKSLSDYAAFFKGNPYSLENSGIRDLLISVAVLPFVMFFIQFILPPFVIAYVL